jgi:hypothetical protein
LSGVTGKALEPSPYRSQRTHHVTIPGPDAVRRRGESGVGELFGADGTDVCREQHHVHVDVETVLQCQAGVGNSRLGIHRQGEIAQCRRCLGHGIRRRSTSR